MANNYLTGEGGVMEADGSAFACLRHFLVGWSTVPGRGYCSRSAAGPIGAQGNEDWFVMGNGYGSEPTSLPGDTFTFKGADSGGSGHEGPAIMEKLRVIWDVEGADLIWWEVLAYGTGALVPKATAQISISDTGAPLPTNARGKSVWIDGTEHSIRRAVLDIMCLNAVHNDTDTNGYTGRSRGNFAAEFEIDLYFDDRSELPSEHGFVPLIIEAEDATTWNLTYVYIDKVQPKVDIEGDRDGRAVENHALVHGMWFGWNGGTVQGSIIAPSTTQIWPTA
jgi:hypothetical protein